MNGYTLVGMLYTAVQTALLACVRYWLYQDSLRVPAKRMYAVVFVLSLGGTGLWIRMGGLPGMPFAYFRLFVAVVMFLLSCCVIKEPFAKHAYTYAFIMVYDLALEITASFVQQLVMPGGRDWVFALTAALLLALSFRLSLRYLKRMIEQLVSLANDRIWGWLSVISFSFVFMNLMFTFPSQALSLQHLLSRYLMLLGIVGLYFATTRAIRTMQEATEARSELMLTKRRIAIQQEYYDRMIAQMDEVRRIRHDLRHHKAALAALIQQGDTDALMAYADVISPDEEIVPVTGNLSADSVLLYYQDAAKALGVRMETNLSLGRKTPLTDPDLCVILGNLLENAVEAQRYLPKEDRFIRITAKGDPSNLVLAVDNRFDGVLTEKNGEYLSRKSGEGHGIGLASVRSVCEKYGGVLQLETDNDLFMAGVVIGL